MKRLGGLLSGIPDHKIHIWFSVFWALMVIPTLLWWSNSVAVVLIYSVYALVGAHVAAAEGAKNDHKIDEIIERLKALEQREQ